MSVVAQTATLVHDFTMADIDRATRKAIRQHLRRGSGMLDYDDRYAAGWDAIVQLLYTSYDQPTFWTLVDTAVAAIDQELIDYKHHHGLARQKDRDYAPNFEKYWLPVGRQKHWTDDGFSDHLCEVLALRDALSVLTADQYEAIATLAAFDNGYKAAAAALGLEYHCFYYRVLSGRAKIRAAWFGDEQPVRRGNGGDTCRSGHSRAEHGYKREDGYWQCQLCRRNDARRRNARKR